MRIRRYAMVASLLLSGICSGREMPIEAEVCAAAVTAGASSCGIDVAASVRIHPAPRHAVSAGIGCTRLEYAYASESIPSVDHSLRLGYAFRLNGSASRRVTVEAAAGLRLGYERVNSGVRTLADGAEVGRTGAFGIGISAGLGVALRLSGTVSAGASVSGVCTPMGLTHAMALVTGLTLTINLN